MGRRKPRSDAKLKTLPDEQQELLWEFLNTEGNGVRDAVPFCKSEFDLETSTGALSGWWRWYSLKKELDAAEAATTQATLFYKERNPDASPEDLAEAGNMMFMASAMQSKDPKAWFFVLKNYTDLEKVKLDRDKLEQRIREYEAKVKQVGKTVKDTKLSPEEREQKIKEIFGLA